MKEPGKPCLSQEACEAIRKIVAVTTPERGGAPAYTPWHVIEALRILSLLPAGRPRISEDLGLGESSTKTLVRRLEELGLVLRSQKGRVVSDYGKRVLEIINKQVLVGRCKRQLEGLGACVYVVVTYPPPRSLTDVYAIRDFVVARGCRMVAIGSLEGLKVEFPGLPKPLEREITDAIGSLKRPEGPATVIVVPPECEHSAISAALDLEYHCCAV